MELGGNRNDSAIENNLNSCFGILESPNVKDIRKIGIYSILKILVRLSPYITFKKFLQKTKNSPYDNFHTVISVPKSKNIKLRIAYLQFLQEYIKYIAEKKDSTYPPIQITTKTSALNGYLEIRWSRRGRHQRSWIICLLKLSILFSNFCLKMYRWRGLRLFWNIACRK